MKNLKEISKLKTKREGKLKKKEELEKELEELRNEINDLDDRNLIFFSLLVSSSIPLPLPFSLSIYPY